MTQLSDFVGVPGGGVAQSQGTWSPTIENAISGTPASGNKGHWVRTGNVVNVWGQFDHSSFSGGSSTEMLFGGLPFNVTDDPPFSIDAFPFSGILTPRNGLRMNEVVTDSGVATWAFHQIAVVGLQGTKRYQLMTYTGTNDTATLPNKVLIATFDQITSSVPKFSMSMTYLTNDP